MSGLKLHCVFWSFGVSVKYIDSYRNTYEVFGMFLHDPAYNIIFIVNMNPIQVKCYFFG